MKTPIVVVQLCFDFTIVLFFRLKYFQRSLDFLLRSTMNGAYCVNETWTQECHSSMYLFTAVFFQFCHCVILNFECRRFWKAGKMTVWGLGTCRKSRPLYFSECCSLPFSFSHFPFPHARTSAKPWRSRGWRSMMTRKNLRHRGTLKWYLLKRRRSEQPGYFEHGGMSWNLYTQYKGSYVHDAAAGVFGMKFHYFMIFKSCWPRLGIDS